MLLIITIANMQLFYILQSSIHRSLCILLGIVFILSAITKAFSLKTFEGEVMLYLEIYFNSWLSDYSIHVAALICLAELTTGIFYLLPKLSRYANLAGLAALSVFIYLTGDNYFNPSVAGRIESCGCFGELIHFTPLQSFIKSYILWVIALICMVSGKNH